jgi:hypothetical protein
MTTACTLHSLVDRHFAGRIRPADERRLREHLSGCAGCRDRYERHLLLSRLDPRALPAQERLGRALGLDGREPRSRLWVPALGALAVACLALLMVRLPGAGQEGFTARGSGVDPLAESLVVYAVGPQGPAPAGASLGAHQELAFAYRNPEARRYLMVFAVDEEAHVFWYHPSWTDPGEDPAAIPLQPGEALHELPEAISQPLPVGRLTVYGVFLDEPLTVRQVEERLAAAGAGGVEAALPRGAHVRTLELQVVP